MTKNSLVRLHRTNSNNLDFRQLVKELDSDLSIRDGDEHDFYAQFNTIDAIKHVVVAYEENIPVGCGAIKQYGDTPAVMEVKRMYVRPHRRGKGIASIVLNELEAWAKELDCSRCILETGKKQPEAIRLYQKNNYTQIPNFGQYEHVENSVCFEKIMV